MLLFTSKKKVWELLSTTWSTQSSSESYKRQYKEFNKKKACRLDQRVKLAQTTHFTGLTIYGEINELAQVWEHLTIFLSGLLIYKQVPIRKFQSKYWKRGGYPSFLEQHMGMCVLVSFTRNNNSTRRPPKKGSIAKEICDKEFI